VGESNRKEFLMKKLVLLGFVFCSSVTGASLWHRHETLEIRRAEVASHIYAGCVAFGFPSQGCANYSVSVVKTLSAEELNQYSK
jgi:hypothetical protein